MSTTSFDCSARIAGVTLSDLLRERGPLPVHEACDSICQTCLGLDYAYGHNLVHRDIKPGNLMLADDGTVKILDFGLVLRPGDDEIEVLDFVTDLRCNSRLTAAGSAMGTPDYMAPEQVVDAHSVDHRADEYSLGCTLYHLLSGQVPFPMGSTLDKMNAHIREKPTSLAALCPTIPPALIAIIERMMAKQPSDRYGMLFKVARALMSFLK